MNQKLINCNNDYQKIQIEELDSEYALQCLLGEIERMIRMCREESVNKTDEQEDYDNQEQQEHKEINKEEQEISIENELKTETDGLEIMNCYYYPTIYVNNDSKVIYHMMLHYDYTLANRDGYISMGIIDYMLPSYSETGQQFKTEIIDAINNKQN